jgi:hypothetical protein
MQNVLFYEIDLCPLSQSADSPAASFARRIR